MSHVGTKLRGKYKSSPSEADESESSPGTINSSSQEESLSVTEGVEIFQVRYRGNETGPSIEPGGLVEFLGPIQLPESAALTIDLHNNNLGGSDFAALSHWLHGLDVRKISVSHCNIDLKSCVLLAKTLDLHPTIQVLNLSDNRLFQGDASLLPLFFSSLLTRNLRRLDLSGNAMTLTTMKALASSLAESNFLEILRLSDCNIDSASMVVLMGVLENNTCLRTLDVQRNPVKKKDDRVVAAILAAILRNLTLFEIFLPGGIDGQKQITAALEQNRVNNVNGELAFTSMPTRNACFSERMWVSVPYPVFGLEHLRELDVSNNQLSGLPLSLCNLKQLITLDVSNNMIQLSALPVHVFSIDSLKVFNVSGNPLVKQLPDGVDSSQLHLFADWSRNYMKQEVNCRQVKVLVLGQENVGKTTLVTTLRRAHVSRVRKKFLTLAKKVHDTYFDRKWTDGIIISDVTIGSGDQEVLFKFWDFAGQETYYPTHQFFLTDEAIYVVVFDLTDGSSQARLTYWIEAIESKVADADILVVATHADKVTHELTASILSSVESKMANRKDSTIRAVLAMDAHKEGTSIAALKEKLRSMAVQRLTKMLGVAFPRSFSLLQECCREESKSLSYPVIHHETFRRYAHVFGIQEGVQTQAAADFLNYLGSILYFPKQPALADLIVVDPGWLVTVMARLVTDRDTMVKSAGTFELAQVGDIWHTSEFPLDSHSSIVRLLEGFEVIHRVVREGHGGTKTGYVVPCLLLPDSPIDLEQIIAENSIEANFYIRTYLFDFVPHGFVSQLLIRLMHVTNIHHHFWKSGMLGSLVERGFRHFLYVQWFDDNCYKIQLHIHTHDTSGRFLHIVSSAVDSLLEGWYSKVKVKRYAPKNNKATALGINLDKILQALMKGKTSEVGVLSDVAPDYAMQQALRIPMSELKDEQDIGVGSFGTIASARYRSTPVVLKKVVSVNNNKTAAFKDFLKECWMMSFLKHPHVLALLGICFDPLEMVIEYMNEGNLRDFLDKMR